MPCGRVKLQADAWKMSANTPCGRVAVSNMAAKMSCGRVTCGVDAWNAVKCVKCRANAWNAVRMREMPCECASSEEAQTITKSNPSLNLTHTWIQELLKSSSHWKRHHNQTNQNLCCFMGYFIIALFCKFVVHAHNLMTCLLVCCDLRACARLLSVFGFILNAWIALMGSAAYCTMSFGWAQNALNKYCAAGKSREATGKKVWKSVPLRALGLSSNINALMKCFHAFNKNLLPKKAVK